MKKIVLVVLGVMSLVAACGGDDGGGVDGDCADGATQCTGNTFETCTDGAFEVTNQCTGLCDPGLGCVECRPGTDFCENNNVISCSDTGVVGGVVEDCGDLTCVSGACVDLCKDAEDAQSYIGCEYYAVDLDNALQVDGPPFLPGICNPFGPPGAVIINTDVCVDDQGTIVWHCDGDGSCQGATETCQPDTEVCALDASSAPFAVVVSNPQATDIDITVSNGTISMNVNVLAGEVKPIFPADIGFPDQSINHTSQGGSGYRLSATAPFVAYQFNPLDNVDVFSNDGSLLLPRHAFDAEYLVLTMPSLDIQGRRGYATIVAHEADTEITVTPSADIAAGPVIGTILAGTPTVFTLGELEVLNIEAAGTGDLTGTLIVATDPAKKIGVFAGHEATSLPAAGADCCADHLEEMMFPLSTWGSEYAVAKSQERLAGETDIVRIVAQTDSTNISFNGGGSPSCAVLNRGEHCEVDIVSDVEISADQPILVGHVLRSTTSLGGGSGDPSLALAVPTEQFRSTYSFLIPADYDMQFASIVAPAGGTVSIDGTDVTSQLTSFGSGDWVAGRIPVQPGQHELSCPDQCGIELYGYSDAVSYMFAGGLDLERIVIN